MNTEDNIFKTYIPDFGKLKKYGFEFTGENYCIEKLFKDNLFKAIIKINPNGKVAGTVYDIENGEEFLPLRIAGKQGGFTGKVISEYEKILLDIRNECFAKTYFIFPQSNRITQKIIKKYGNNPEFLWDKAKGSGVFRNPVSNKWYAAILDTLGTKFQLQKEEIVEVINLKLFPAHIEELLKQKGFYPAYHMNKKYWISIILNETVTDEEIMQLIEESHSFSNR